MGETADIAGALITGGIGAALGSVATAIIQTVSKRGVSRAEAADRVTNAAGNLADRLDKLNASLERENRLMRKAIVTVTDILDEMTPYVVDAEIRVKAHDALRIARLALK